MKQKSSLANKDFPRSIRCFHDLDYNGWNIEFGTLEKVSDYYNAPFFINQRDGFKYFCRWNIPMVLMLLEIKF